MLSRFSAALLCLLSLFISTARGSEMELAELIEVLRSQGHVILYSDSLVHRGQKVAVDEISMASLESAARQHGLLLEQVEQVWVVTRGEAPPRSANLEKPEVDSPPLLETVIVTGTLHRFPASVSGLSAHSFTAADMALVPSLGSDALRATLRLPGVSSVGVSAKPQIRGGLKDELLVIQDGVELLEPFHLADYHSAYSSIDYHTIESLDVYTGGFPSRYGNRMSGVMDIRNRWDAGDYNTDIGVSTFSNFIHTRGDFSGQRPGQYLLSLRQGDLTDLTDYIDARSGEPDYLDVGGRLNLQLSQSLGLSAGAVYAEDDIVFEDEEEAASSQIETRYAWLSADWRWSPSLGSRVTLSWLDFEREKRQASFEDDEEDEGKGGFLDHRQQVQRWALRNDWTALQRAVIYEAGWQLEWNSGDYRHRSYIDRGELADILGSERLVADDLDLEPDGVSAGAYLQAEWELAEGLLIQPSLRWDMQDYYLDDGSEHQWSPRLGLAYDLTESSQLRLSVGRFHQPEGVHELQVIDGVSRFYAPQYADQLVAGAEWSGGQLQLTAEVYYKRYRDQKGRYENVFNPFVLLPEMEPDRVSLSPSRAEALGADLDLRGQLGESLEGNLRYSYMDARDRLSGERVDRRWSQQHTVNAGLAWRRGNFTLSLAAIWHSGWRSTLLPSFVPEDVVIPVETVLNNTELRDFFSLDLGARYAWEFPRARLEVYADVSNLTDRKNEAGIDFDVEEADNGYELLPDHETLLGRVPSFGVTLSF